jgi:hypothetical protein
MGFHINVYNMPRINDYKHAKEIFNSKTAVRGESQSVRRLGDRYEKEKWLRQEIIDGIEVYIAGYYNTDLVRYYPTHKEITLGGYPSTSTEYFVGYIGGLSLYPFEHKKYVPAPFTRSPLVKNNQIECSVYLHGEHRYMNAYDWYAIGYDNKPIYPEQFEKAVEYKFDASQMRELRKPFKDTLKYIDTILKLNNNTGMENDRELDDKVRAYGNNILDLLVDGGNRYLAMYFLCRRTQRWEYFRNSNSVPRVNIGQIKRYADKMIKLENPQVLVEVQPATSV